ncbi:hypothetical protein AYI69_g10973 [Smittium culicis]|uniref:Uncharacterized protein n=1 Tax=Smittium culicis TaxID=133412 RepID=A0A1R1X222_9FUNG|nr:hypothetical protein AYI69_g10973 [Smittium culicis]
MQIYGDSAYMSYGYSNNHLPSKIFDPSANYRECQEFYGFNSEYQYETNYNSLPFKPRTFQTPQESFSQGEIGLDQNNDYKEISKNETEISKSTDTGNKVPKNVNIEPTSSEKWGITYNDIYLSKNEDILSPHKDKIGYDYGGEIPDKAAIYKGTSKNFDNEETSKDHITFESLVSKNAEIEYERSLNSSSSGNSYKINKTGFRIDNIGSEEGEIIDDDDDDNMHFSD